MNKVPKLRFKEFNGEWEKLNAEEIFKNISNKNHNGDLPILAVTQDKGVVYRDSLDLKINSSETGIKNYKIIEPGDFVISLRSFQGGIEYSSILGISSPAYTVLKPKIEISDFFYKVYLKKESFISELNSTIEGIRDGKQISYAMFSKLKLPYTKVEEQQKIADFLSSIDKKISITEEKLELFKEYKKGIMQKIFKQELRFKDSNGNDYPEWEEKKLGEISSNIMYGLNSSAVEFDGENKYIRITDINEDNGKFEPNPLTSPSGTLDNNFLVNENDILFARTGASVGKTYHYNIKDEKLYFAGFLIRFHINKANSKFIYYNTLKKDYNKWVALTSMRTGQPGINAEEYKNYKIKLPCLEEQQKIADFLSSIDNKIDNLAAELENLKEFKKGLLQQMFV